MRFKLIVLLSAILWLESAQAVVSTRKFPKNFKFGSATAAYQIEGGWDADGKGPNVWDKLTHNTPQLFGGATGDVACDSYHKYKDDIAMLKQMGVQNYRFSISWARILPKGLAGLQAVNQPGVDYYKNLIQGLKEANIEPIITLYHWDIPTSLDHMGGFPNRLMVDYFVEYADLAFSLFGDDVKTWLTFNEPKSFCEEYYDGAQALFAPYIPNGIISYECTHNVLLAHAKTYRLYERKYKRKQKGKISMALSFEWSEPASNSPKDQLAAERKRQFDYGWFASPLVYGHYPQIMIDRIAEKSREQGFPKSRLPSFTLSERLMIRGTLDFLAINHYSTWLVKWIEEIPNANPSFVNDTNVLYYKDTTWQTSASTWLTVVPWGFRNLLNWVKDNFQNKEILITENGYSDDGNLNDTKRIEYYQSYLSEALGAIYEDKVRLIGHTAWSLMDNFEWVNGYNVRFGLYHVDFTSPNRTRTAKASAEYYGKIAKTRCLLEECTD